MGRKRKGAFTRDNLLKQAEAAIPPNDSATDNLVNELATLTLSTATSTKSKSKPAVVEAVPEHILDLAAYQELLSNIPSNSHECQRIFNCQVH